MKDEKSEQNQGNPARLEMVIESQSLNQVKMLEIEHSELGAYTINAEIKIHGDYRWHRVSQVVHNENDVFLIADAVIDCHVHQHPGDSAKLESWRLILSDKKAYRKGKITLSLES